MGPRLVSLAAVLAKRQGAAAAQSLLQSGRAWMADPANESSKQACSCSCASTPSGRAARSGELSAKLYRDVEKRARLGGLVGARPDGDALRGGQHGPGARARGALAAYVAQASAGVHLINGASKPNEARVGVIRALDAEERMLRGERLSADEKGRALQAVAAARAACAGHAA